MADTARCADCSHHPHPDRECVVVLVDGPRTPVGAPKPTPQDPHPGRNVTPCGCKVYRPEQNGVEF